MFRLGRRRLCVLRFQGLFRTLIATCLSTVLRSTVLNGGCLMYGVHGSTLSSTTTVQIVVYLVVQCDNVHLIPFSTADLTHLFR